MLLNGRWGEQPALEAIAVKNSTWHALEQFFLRFPTSKASPVPVIEIERVIVGLGAPVDPTYVEFISRYGGAMVGAYPIFGLERAQSMGLDFADIAQANLHYRKQHWPGVERWLVFSIDLGGNPVGIDVAHRVWLSDHDTSQIVCIEASFEAFLRRWALDLEAPAETYLDQIDWPQL